jgi:hypothetical protein
MEFFSVYRFWLGLLIGLFIGAPVGMWVLALCQMISMRDHYHGEYIERSARKVTRWPTWSQSHKDQWKDRF